MAILGVRGPNLGTSTREMSRGPSAKSRGRLCAVSRKTGVGTLRAARRADACALQRCSKTIARRRRRRVGTTTCVGQDRRARECVRDGMNASVCFGKFPRRFRAVVAISRCVFMTELGKQPKRDRYIWKQPDPIAILEVVRIESCLMHPARAVGKQERAVVTCASDGVHLEVNVHAACTSKGDLGAHSRG